jgi:hypothetical protein
MIFVLSWLPPTGDDGTYINLSTTIKNGSAPHNNIIKPQKIKTLLLILTWNLAPTFSYTYKELLISLLAKKINPCKLEQVIRVTHR